MQRLKSPKRQKSTPPSQHFIREFPPVIYRFLRNGELEVEALETPLQGLQLPASCRIRSLEDLEVVQKPHPERVRGEQWCTRRSPPPPSLSETDYKPYVLCAVY